jgi:CBS domain-containing membrane protein
MEFSHEEANRWRARLEQERKAVVLADEATRKQAVEDLSLEGTGEISSIRLHPADLASDAQEIEMLESLSQKNIQRAHEIEDALVRIDEGTYGICLNCGDVIGEKRLLSIPESRYCLDCETTMEHQNEPSASAIFLQNLSATKDLQSALATIARISISDIRREKPISVNANETLDTAAVILSDHGIRHLPVVDSRGDIVGVISDRDLLGVALRLRPGRKLERMENEWSKGRVRQIMTKTPETVSPETSLTEAGTILLDNKISCLPVVEGNRLVGIVTESDFVRLVSQSL